MILTLPVQADEAVPSAYSPSQRPVRIPLSSTFELTCANIIVVVDQNALPPIPCSHFILIESQKLYIFSFEKSTRPIPRGEGPFGFGCDMACEGLLTDVVDSTH